MPLIETEGVVLQSRRFSETSKIIVVFTRDQGKVSILYKGGRKGTKKFPGGLETLNRVELTFYFRSGRELQTFKSFDLLDSYQELRSNLARTYTALSIAETVLRSTADDDPNSSLYADFTAFLSTLNRLERHPWALRWKCLIDICRSLGFGLSLEGRTAASKGSDIDGFELETGAFVTTRDVAGESTIISSSGEAWGILRFLARCPYETAGRISLSPGSGRHIETLFLNYFKYHIPGLKKFDSWVKLPEFYWESEGSG